MLITGFMKEETTHPPTSDGSCGEVMLEVDAYAHTTKLDGTVRGMYVCTPDVYLGGGRSEEGHRIFHRFPLLRLKFLYIVVYTKNVI